MPNGAPVSAVGRADGLLDTSKGFPMSGHGTDFVDVLLEGGPADVPRKQQVLLDDETREKIKIPLLGGTEHFAVVGDPAADVNPRLYRWTMRTRIAE
jgi:hypothetical protein